MTVKRLIGPAPSQISRNKDLGSLAFLDKSVLEMPFTILGKNYKQTTFEWNGTQNSTGGTSVIDCKDITQDSGGVYLVFLANNTNPFGSSQYRGINVGIFSITHDFSGSAVYSKVAYTSLHTQGGGSGNYSLTVSATFTNGSSDSASPTTGSGYYLRLRHAGQFVYTNDTSKIGINNQCRIVKILGTEY